jgi:transposase-like protein
VNEKAQCVFSSRLGVEHMNTRAIAVEFRLAHWAQIMQERVESGMTIRSFCKAKGMGLNTYFYWQKKLREAAVSQMAAAAQPEQQALVPSGWATVSPAEETAPAQPQGLTLRVGGAEIEVRPGYDEVLLASVIKTLSRPC